MAENTKTFVVDSSVLMAVLMPDENKSLKVKKLLKIIVSKNKIIAPNLLIYEIGNGLKSAALSKRITFSQAGFLLNTFNQLSINLVSIDINSVFKTAIEHKMTFYDASYFYLAKLNKCKLLTLDHHLEEIVATER
ncbi:MAG: type II toxin-antitoxin system VapC family toxin [Candidatus Woesebacteria bacterium]|nr:type II toxin-antitoxin system VapC family toxin [Candidatus Woesebacteria bacterium]